MGVLRSKKFWIAVAVLAALVAAFFVWRSFGPKVVTQAVERREIVQKVVVSGRVLPPARVNVGSLSPGVVASVAVKEGDHVKAGDPLVQLDDAESRASLAQAKAGLAQASAKLDQIRTVSGPVATQAHRQADANLEAARLNFERQSALVKSGALGTAQLDDATRALAVAEAQHTSTEAQASGAGPRGADHRLALAAHAQAAASVAMAEVRVAQMRLTAATDALVLTRSVEPGDIVQPGRVLLVLARDGERQLVVQPDEKNLAELQVGQKARAATDAFPNAPFDAEIATIAPSVDPQRGTVEVRLRVPSPPDYLRPDMTVSVDIEVGRRPGALVVAAEAIRDPGSGAPWVWLLASGRVARRDVTLGLRGEGQVEITSGLEERDQVVLPADTKLEPGQKVRAAPATTTR